jgi:hypothetical protein
MTDTTTIPIYRDRGMYLPGMLGQPLPKGPLVGSIVVDEDELSFAAYAYNVRPMLLGNSGNFTAALSLFQRKGPPHPGVKPGGIVDRARKQLYNR